MTRTRLALLAGFALWFGGPVAAQETTGVIVADGRHVLTRADAISGCRAVEVDGLGRARTPLIDARSGLAFVPLARDPRRPALVLSDRLPYDRETLLLAASSGGRGSVLAVVTSPSIRGAATRYGVRTSSRTDVAGPVVFDERGHIIGLVDADRVGRREVEVISAPTIELVGRALGLRPRVGRNSDPRLDARTILSRSAASLVTVRCASSTPPVIVPDPRPDPRPEPPRPVEPPSVTLEAPIDQTARAASSFERGQTVVQLARWPRVVLPPRARIELRAEGTMKNLDPGTPGTAVFLVKIGEQEFQLGDVIEMSGNQTLSYTQRITLDTRDLPGGLTGRPVPVEVTYRTIPNSIHTSHDSRVIFRVDPL
jgi:hypothetical protein